MGIHRKRAARRNQGYPDGGQQPPQTDLHHPAEAGPMTAEELADTLGFSDKNSVRPRLTELKALRLVGVIDKRKARSGRKPRSGPRWRRGRRHDLHKPVM